MPFVLERLAIPNITIARNVMRFLSPANIARISSLACGYWRTLAEDNRLWREKCEEINVNDGKCERAEYLRSKGRDKIGVNRLVPISGCTVKPTTALEKTPSKSNTLHTMEYGMPDAEVGGAIGIDLDW
ncbi:unnamed protein product [Toxocara canis]|uniref:F-box domain-containing protein n=1 Tax=Toxocara canis TaxID=6265 RepID=A0A183UVW9_TOXCA|nr:unnamed protein product [Toxocara canis]